MKILNWRQLFRLWYVHLSSVSGSKGVFKIILKNSPRISGMVVHVQVYWIVYAGGRYFDYMFYIDFEASMAEPRAQYALEHLQVSIYFMIFSENSATIWFLYLIF